MARGPKTLALTVLVCPKKKEWLVTKMKMWMAIQVWLVCSASVMVPAISAEAWTYALM